MRRNLAIATLAGLAALGGCAATPLPEGWCTPKDAYKMWTADPGGVRVVDVRTPEEFVFNGHAVIARNIPFEFLGTECDPNAHKARMTANPRFLEDVRKACKPEETVVVMCSDGQRGAAAADMLRKEGFAKVLNVQGGFEGEYTQDCDCQGKGELVRRGWQQHDLPWTIRIDSDSLYSREHGAPAARP